MALATKYEKIDNQTLRLWMRDGDTINKSDLLSEKGALTNIVNHTSAEKLKIMASVGFSQEQTEERFNEIFQGRIDEIDILLDMLNDDTEDETIPFIVVTQ